MYPPTSVRRSSPILILALQLALCTSLHTVHAAEPDDKPAAAIERLYRSGQAVQAFERLDKALADQPRDPGLHFLKARMLMDAKRVPEARTEYERLTQDFPELPEPFNNLAAIYADEGRLDLARSLLETALRNDPAYLTAQQNLGDVHARLALRSYQAAASAPRVDEGLQRKLKLARDLVGTPTAAR